MPFSAVNGFDCQQNTELRGDLDQEIISHNARLKLARSAAAALHSIRMVPRCPCGNSTMHIGSAPVGDPT